jgi:hypothetical protein
VLTVLGGLAEFERELIRARTGEGRERLLSSLLCSRSWSSLDTDKIREIRSASVSMIRPPRCANGDKG